MTLIWSERKAIGVLTVTYITLPKLFVPLCPTLTGFPIVLVLGVPEGFGNNNYILGFARTEAIAIPYF